MEPLPLSRQAGKRPGRKNVVNPLHAVKEAFPHQQKITRGGKNTDNVHETAAFTQSHTGIYDLFDSDSLWLSLGGKNPLGVKWFCVCKEVKSDLLCLCWLKFPTLSSIKGCFKKQGKYPDIN